MMAMTRHDIYRYRVITGGAKTAKQKRKLITSSIRAGSASGSQAARGEAPARIPCRVSKLGYMMDHGLLAARCTMIITLLLIHFDSARTIRRISGIATSIQLKEIQQSHDRTELFW